MRLWMAECLDAHSRDAGKVGRCELGILLIIRELISFFVGTQSINGIQYHLQLSKAHFAVALNKHVFAASSETDDATPSCCSGGNEDSATAVGSTSASPVNEPPPAGNSTIRRKVHACPHAGCPNVYKQAAGLKYHLAHVCRFPKTCMCSQRNMLILALQGHPDNPPLQLGNVPPALAQKMSARVKRVEIQAR